jgi:nuclease S1
MRLMICTALMWAASHTVAWSWGQEGHSIVGEIAQRRLSDATHRTIANLIGPGASLASMSNWADDERARDRKTSRWHFVDIPLAANDYVPTRDCIPNPEQGDCIVAAIERELAVVACDAKPVTQRRRALSFLVHFLGDLHQPLHTVKEERGGNEVEVTIVVRNGANGTASEDANFHSAWDSGLIRKLAWSWGSYAERLEADWLPSASASLTDGTIENWALETHRVAFDLFSIQPANGVFDEAYLAKARPLLDRQLATAGMRLAKVLNDAVSARRCE